METEEKVETFDTVSARVGHVAVAVGDCMIVWGGYKVHHYY